MIKIYNKSFITFDDKGFFFANINLVLNHI